MSKKRIKEMQQPNLAEAVLPLAVAEIEAGGVGTAGLSSRSVDGFTDSYTATGTFPTGPIYGILPDPDETYVHHTRVQRPDPVGVAAREKLETLLESPHTPDCVRWNFTAGLAEEDLLRGWENDDKDPPSDVLEAIKHVRMFSRGETVHQDEFRMMLHLLFLKGPLSAALSASSTFQGTVPYEWQLAHLRDLIAEHNKRRLPLLLCLKERAQRIKQAPSYGQQLEEVLYT